MGRRLTRTVAGAIGLATAVAFTGLTVPAQAAIDLTPPPGVPVTASAKALPTWQINGVVWDQLIVGNTVYVTGNFTKARPHGAAEGSASEITQQHIMAYDIRTGVRIAAFDHHLNAQGLRLAVSPDKTRLYVGGDFTTVDGKPRGHIAVFDLASGALLDEFTPQINGPVKAILVTDTTIYVGGGFQTIGSDGRMRLAAFDRSSSSLLGWAPRAEYGDVQDMILSPDGSKIIVGGAFTTISGVAASATAALDPKTGQVLPWAMNRRIGTPNPGTWAVTSLSTNGKYVYGSAFNYYLGGLKFEGTFAARPEDGSLVFANDCLGDTYDVMPYQDVMYIAGHPHDCSVIGAYPDSKQNWEHAAAFTADATGKNLKANAYGVNFTDVPASTLLHFHPEMGVGTATGQYQASWTVAGNDEYVVYGGEFPLVNGAPQQGLVRFSRKAGAPTAPPQFESRAPYRTLWAPKPTVRTDGAVNVLFQVAWDPDDATLKHELIRDRGTAAEKVVATADYDTEFWQLSDRTLVDSQPTVGTHTYSIRVTDPSGNEIWSQKSAPITLTRTLALGAYGEKIVADGARHYWRLDETSGLAYDKTGPLNGTYRIGVTRGVAGALTDGNKATRFSGNIYGDVYTEPETVSGAMTMEGWVRTTSTTGGRFVSLVPTNGTTMTTDRHLYINDTGTMGVRAGTSAVPVVESTTKYNDGAWHHVAATISGDTVILYVDGVEAGRRSVALAPAATGAWYLGGDRYGSTTFPNSWSLAGDTDEVAIYGKVLTADQIRTHFELGRGVVNAAPTAAFTATASGLAVTFDGSTSKDDGSVASYTWDFGDGSAPQTTTTPTASHLYAADGRYSVKLTVTDDRGKASAPVTQVVSVASAVGPVVTDPVRIAADRFSRTVDAGWGDAEIGGTWAAFGSASNLSVAGGVGSFVTAPGTLTGAYLPALKNQDNDMRFTLAYDQAVTGGGVSTQVIARGDTSTGAGARLWTSSSGGMLVAPFVKVKGGDSLAAADVAVPGVTMAAGTKVNVRVQVTGSNPTTIRAKVWPVDLPEPADWLTSATTSAADVQQPGGVALLTYLSGAATTPQLATLIDDVSVTNVP